MCFFLRPGNPLLQRTKATEDIVCYKMMGYLSLLDRFELGLKYLFSPYQSPYYDRISNKPSVFRLNEVYFAEPTYKALGIKKVCGIGHVISAGFHSDKLLDTSLRRHSDLYVNPVYLECIIPKGSIYFENDFEYVSDRIIFKRKVTESL